jgi:hypothetical protein
MHGLLHLEDESITILSNVGKYLSVDTASYPRRLEPSAIPLRVDLSKLLSPQLATGRTGKFFLCVNKQWPPGTIQREIRMTVTEK